MEITPEDGTLARNLGLLMLNAARLVDAERFFELATNINPDDEESRVQLERLHISGRTAP